MLDSSDVRGYHGSTNSYRFPLESEIMLLIIITNMMQYQSLETAEIATIQSTLQ